jgi:sporulation protein YlmC with PRC-barrel domain
MFIDWHSLTHLPVFTESGQRLGNIREVEIDVENHHVRKYLVTHGFIGKETFLVTPGQIKEVSNERIIVDDAVIKAEAAEKGSTRAKPALGNIIP